MEQPLRRSVTDYRGVPNGARPHTTLFPQAGKPQPNRGILSRRRKLKGAGGIVTAGGARLCDVPQFRTFFLLPGKWCGLGDGE